ncbi:MAG: acetate non-utilizing protein 9 [Cyphobasidiales sp. Tagirdzhanova-0007]|nr:MAG: acetate non-utilizing protein 9 [Cyphobasidiales sp. Tagirdzhanova-0007]
MRYTIVRLAESVSTGPISARAVSQALLPPLVLYRRLLRSHGKHLPIEMKLLGDDYVKAEFRRTRSADNPLHIIGFLSEWKRYLDEIETGGIGDRGKQLDQRVLEKMSPEQIGQLYELMVAARGGDMTEAQKETQIEETLESMGIPTDGGSKARDP